MASDSLLKFVHITQLAWLPELIWVVLSSFCSSSSKPYVINLKYWGGSNISAPIFAYLGAEQPLGDNLTWLGFLTDNALQFKALLVYIEHRCYGESVPFGPMEEAFENASTLGYFNSAQAIADYAEILIHVKKELHAQHSLVIVIGGSYGGMLAAWLRLKYPHVTVGALASSAPVFYFDNIVAPENGYYSIVSRRLVNRRKIEVRIIKGWIDKYSVDLQALKHEKPLQN
ncbi:hypothetical protein PRUPE_6G031200 [Prunus persica]|uniref:Serine carboxypeptidase S28 family protein n=1 Tax=Prunus persica TaxID=3760 RepID=M5WIT0_PRUPE|nr:hypothetical protein PRUPE_6G031200 [Prunus persica]